MARATLQRLRPQSAYHGLYSAEAAWVGHKEKRTNADMHQADALTGGHTSIQAAAAPLIYDLRHRNVMSERFTVQTPSSDHTLESACHIGQQKAHDQLAGTLLHAGRTCSTSLCIIVHDMIRHVELIDRPPHRLMLHVIILAAWLGLWASGCVCSAAQPHCL